MPESKQACRKHAHSGNRRRGGPCALPAEAGLYNKIIRRIRTICEFAEHCFKTAPCAAGRGEPLPYSKAKVSAPFFHLFFCLPICYTWTILEMGGP